jgi:probable rRNA maturation factor
MDIDLQIAEDLNSVLDSYSVSLLKQSGEYDDTLEGLRMPISIWLASMHNHIRDKRLDAPVCIRMCNALESRRLNKLYRGIDKPTNVLSFPAHIDHNIEHPLLGDLALCWPVLLGEAAEQGKQPIHHLIHLLVHGILHLLDYDHKSDQQARQMEDLEVRVLADLGIGNPYFESTKR